MVDFNKSALEVKGPLNGDQLEEFLYASPLRQRQLGDPSAFESITRWVNVEGLDPLTVNYYNYLKQLPICSFL